MLKIYEYNGLTYQFEEGEQPEGAKLVKQQPEAEEEQPEVKEAKPANKARTTRNKAAK